MIEKHMGSTCASNALNLFGDEIPESIRNSRKNKRTWQSAGVKDWTKVDNNVMLSFIDPDGKEQAMAIFDRNAMHFGLGSNDSSKIVHGKGYFFVYDAGQFVVTSIRPDDSIAPHTPKKPFYAKAFPGIVAYAEAFYGGNLEIARLNDPAKGKVVVRETDRKGKQVSYIAI
jgi:hypothetical protein